MRKKTMMKIALQISIRHSSCQEKNNDGSFVSDLIWQMYFKLYHEETPSVHSWKRKIFVFLCSIYNNYQYSYVIKIQEIETAFMILSNTDHFFWTHIQAGIHSILLLDLNIPPYVEEGSSAKLICIYEIELDGLYR